MAPRSDGSSGGGPRGLSRRASFRPEIRAAIALEESGELQDAARVFEYAGEHAQAATLRLEHSRSLRDPAERLDSLREGAARNPGNTASGRALHLTLAEALLAAGDAAPDSAQRRTLELEAATALEEAGEGGHAGEIYESLGMLKHAALAYEQSGEISRLELVLELLERHEQHTKALQDRDKEIDEAIATGRRRLAHALLSDAVQTTPSTTQALVHIAALPPSSGPQPTPSGWAARLHQLEERLLRRPRVDLRWARGVTSIRATPSFSLGRAPDADLSVPDPRMSRFHAEMRFEEREGRAELCIVDLGSKAGTFWDGEALIPGEPIPIEFCGELGLGLSTSIEVHPLRERSNSDELPPIGALLRTQTDDAGPQRWSLFLPGGGPLWLAPQIRVPATVLFAHRFVIVDFAPRVGVTLHGTPLPDGAHLELMVGDVISLSDVPLTLEVLG